MSRALLLSLIGAVLLPGLASAQRPTLSGTEQTFVSDDGWFRVHWTESGVDSTTLAYVQEVAVAADSSWLVQVIELGFLEPPSDLGLGGDDLYDIYLLDSTVEGYVSTAGEPDDPTTPNNDSASHMVVSTGLDDVEERRCLVAGLFQYACQAAADVDEATWLKVNCSTWAQEQVYPEYDCYLTAEGDGSIVYPWKSIPSSAAIGVSYSWAWFIEDRLGAGAVADVWQRCADVAGANSWEACEDVFEDYGVQFQDGFMEYGMWRFLTHEYWLDGWGFGPDAQSWEPGPTILDQHLVSSLPDSANWSGSDENDPEIWGLNWIRVDLSEYQSGWVTMDFQGDESLGWMLGVLMWNGEACQFYPYDVPASGELSVSVAGSGWDYAVFFPARVAESAGMGAFHSALSYSTEVEGEEGGPGEPMLQLAGNPVGAGTEVTAIVLQPGHVSLAVYDLAGRRVATLLDDELASGSHSVSLEGLDLLPGSYLFTLRTAGGMAAGRMTVLR